MILQAFSWSKSYLLNNREEALASTVLKIMQLSPLCYSLYSKLKALKGIRSVYLPFKMIFVDFMAGTEVVFYFAAVYS